MKNDLNYLSQQKHTPIERSSNAPSSSVKGKENREKNRIYFYHDRLIRSLLSTIFLYKKSQ